MLKELACDTPLDVIAKDVVIISAFSKCLAFEVSARILLLVLLISAICQPCNGFCPAKCVCNDSEQHTSVECSNTNLDLIPFLLNPNVKILKLPSNEIATVDQSLAFYPKVELLDLSNNKISTIGAEDFEAQTKLIILNLSDNRIVTIKNGSLDNMLELRELYLENNLISSIESSAFSYLINLNTLDLSKNNIKAINDKIFESNTKLENLKLNYNRIYVVPSSAVKKLLNLRYLELRGNYLSSVSAQAFKSLRSLVSLSMDKNNISEVNPRAFEGLINLITLSLTDNRLTTVPSVALRPLTKLEILDLSGNLFQVLGKESFHHSPSSLLHLHLTRCPRLSRVDSGAFNSLKSLQSLKLSHNTRLVHLGQSVFSSLLKLTDLDLTACGIVYIHPKQMPKGLKTRLHLAGNPLHCNCSLLWLAHSPTNSSNYLDTPTCATPPNLYGVPVAEVDPREAGCNHRLSVMAIAVCVGVVVLGILIIAIFLACRWRKQSSAISNKDIDMRYPPQERTFREMYRDPTSELIPVPTPIFSPKYGLPCQETFPHCLGERHQCPGGCHSELSQPPYSLQPANHPLLTPTTPSPTNNIPIPVDWLCPSPYEDDSLHWYTTFGKDGREYLTGELKRDPLPPPPPSVPPEPLHLPPSPPNSVRLQRKASLASQSAPSSHPTSPVLPSDRRPAKKGRRSPYQRPSHPMTYI